MSDPTMYKSGYTILEPIPICDGCQERLFPNHLMTGTLTIRALPDGPERTMQVELEPVDTFQGDCSFCDGLVKA